MFLGIIYLVFGVFCCSTAVIFIKASVIHPVPLSSYRLLVAGAVLLPLFVRSWREHRTRYSLEHLRRTFWPALMLGLHFISWISGARLTTAANATLIVNLVPVAMPLFALRLAGEIMTATEVIGTALALGGVALLGSADFHLSRQYFWGDILCFVSMLLFAAYLAFGRKNRDFPSTWLYVVPLYLFAGLLCLLFAVFLTNPFQVSTAKEAMLILGLAIVPTVLGHSILNRSLVRFRTQLVSLVNMGQFTFAGVMAFLLLHEVPHWGFYLASALVMGGAALALVRRGDTEVGSVRHKVEA